MPLKSISMKLRHFELRRATENILLVVSILLLIDAFVALFGTSYLSTNVNPFLYKSWVAILSDLLFLEGTVIFAVGAFFAVAIALQKPRPTLESSTEQTDNSEQARRRIHPSIIMIVTGAILIGLSITVGTVGAPLL